MLYTSPHPEIHPSNPLIAPRCYIRLRSVLNRAVVNSPLKATNSFKENNVCARARQVVEGGTIWEALAGQGLHRLHRLLLAQIKDTLHKTSHL